MRAFERVKAKTRPWCAVLFIVRLSSINGGGGHAVMKETFIPIAVADVGFEASAPTV